MEARFSKLDMPEGEAVKVLSGLGFKDPKRAFRNVRLLSASFGGRVDEVVDASLASPSPDDALNNTESVVKEVPGEVLLTFLENKKNISRLVVIAGSSPYLSGILSKSPEHFDWLFNAGGLLLSKGLEVFKKELGELLHGAGDYDAFEKGLRAYRNREFLRIGARDLLRLSPLEEVTGELSDLASASLDASFDYAWEALRRSYGVPYYTDESGERREAQFTVIGLGKLGGRELNFSSDIDIMYVYSSDRGETAGVAGEPSTRLHPHEFFTKLAHIVTRLISDVTEDGFVFRVDLGLRPEGKSGDMVNSLRSAEVYYESWGQSWERAALTKARSVAGSRELGERFLETVRPFVFRRYLDFTAIEEIRSMKEKIDLSLLRRNPDTVDVKLGAGGIREIEFIVQALELIHGGRDPEVRERNSLKALEKLERKRFLKGADAETLGKAYVFLRDLEHRIQIVDGRQTQAIPARAEAVERLSRMMGFPGKESFWEEYKRLTSSVHETYRSFFYRAEAAPPVPEEVLVLFSPDMTPEEAARRLPDLGFRDGVLAQRNLELIRTGPPSLRLSPRGRVLLERLGPFFLRCASSSPDPDMALSLLEAFVSSVGARSTFYALLSENPRVTEELIKLFGTSAFLSRGLIEHVENLDLLLSEELSIPVKDKKAVLEELFREVLSPGKDYEERLDALRRLRNQEVFRIGLNDIAGLLKPEEVSAQITGLAEASLDVSWRVALEEVERVYGSPGDARFTVLGLGKLGGRELLYGSDLDIIFLYEAKDPQAMTRGARPVSVHEFFVKLCQRIISVLTLKTREGSVFSVDTRLRPSGSAGPLVITRASFINYHTGKTAVWERQALTKARAVAGDLAFGREVLGEVAEVLYSKPFTGEDASEILRIRKRMEAELAKEGPGRVNIKTGKGGLVDIEFLVQALQLKRGGEKRSVVTPSTFDALARLRDEGVISPDDYGALTEAYRFYRLLEMRLRVVHDRPEGYLFRGSDELTALARSAGYKDRPEELYNDYVNHSEKVRSLYLKYIGGNSL